MGPIYLPLRDEGQDYWSTNVSSPVSDEQRSTRREFAIRESAHLTRDRQPSSKGCRIGENIRYQRRPDRRLELGLIPSLRPFSQPLDDCRPSFERVRSSPA
jgi:hypothetical protein